MATLKTLTVYPSGYISDDYAYASAENIENGYNSADNTTYATINLTTGSRAETYIYYTFDLSAIPDGAVITSVSCSANVTISSTSSLYISSRTMQLYSGTTAKGSSSSIPSSAAATTITAGNWTKDELTVCRLKLYVKRASLGATTARNIKFYGASLTIEYAEPDIIPIAGNTTVGGIAKEIAGGYVNIGGVWKTMCKSYSNINGVWKPTHKTGEVTFIWKKYAVEQIKTADGWTWGGDSFSVLYDGTPEFENSNSSSTKKYVPTYENDELISLDWGTVSHSTVVAGSVLYDDLDYVKFPDTTGWRVGSGEVVKNINPNYIYYIVGGSYGSDGIMTRMDLKSPIYNPTYEYQQGEYIEDVTSSDYNAYPENGVQDGYWYVRQ